MDNIERFEWIEKKIDFLMVFIAIYFNIDRYTFHYKLFLYKNTQRSSLCNKRDICKL